MTSGPSLRAAYGRTVLKNAMYEAYKKDNPHGDPNLPKFPPPLSNAVPDQDSKDSWSPGKVCIIGAGAAGLATAIYMHDACAEAEVTPPTIDIYEATERPGGRVYTYQFTDSENPAKHNYYDIGAMRIPEINTMKR